MRYSYRMSLLKVALAQEEGGIISVVNNFLPGGIANIFYIGLGIAAILALGVIIFAGILYASSGDSESRKKDAKAWLLAAVKGLAVVALGFVIISVINPRITTVVDYDLKDLPVPEVNIQPVSGYIPPTDSYPKTHWRGDYSNSAVYAAGDVVSYQNVSYMAITSATGIPPTDTSKWQVFSSTGEIPSVTGTPAYSEVPLLKQGGDPWGGKKYGPNCGGATYSTSGCGPTSVAMAVIYFTGNRYMTKSTAVETVGSEMVKRGWRPCGNGTAWAGIVGAPKLYGLTSKTISGQSGIASCLRNGGVIVALMRAATSAEVESLKNTPRDRTPIFTTGGHYIVVKGIDETKNRVYINDPARRNVQSSEIGHFLKYRRMTWCINNK